MDAQKYILSNLSLDAAELVPIDINQRIVPQSISINTLGKYLLKAAGEGDVEEIKNLMTKGAPFTADWLGTSPLHLAALNNHLEVCEILLRAGICKDSRTKVDRTPLHMAAYEGHIEIVECLLKNNADYDCRDLLGMTPLHWAAQNGHAEIAAMLITYGATTNVANKFSLTPIDIAYQIGRNDIIDIITLGRKNPLIATEHLQLEMSGNENSTDTDTLSIKIESIKNNNLLDHVSHSDVIQLDDECDDSIENTFEPVSHEVTKKNRRSHAELVNQSQNTNSFSESMKILQQHGITMLPADDNNILSSVMESGHSVVLTDVGKEVLNSVKSMENVEFNSLYNNNETVVLPKKKKKIITLTQEEFLAMANGTNKTSSDNNLVIKQLTGKLISTNQTQQKTPIKRIVMKNNKIIPISPTVNQSNKTQKNETYMDLETILKQLAEARKLAEEYKQKYLKKEAEAERYKQQLKILMSQKL